MNDEVDDFLKSYTVRFAEPKISLAEGSVYKVFVGSFSTITHVLIKVADRCKTTEDGKTTHEELALNDIGMMQTLCDGFEIMDVITQLESPEEITLVVSRFEMGFDKLLRGLAAGSEFPNVKLGGLKYAGEAETASELERDKIQAAIVMYCFLKKQIVSHRPDDFKPDWSGDRFYNFKQLHLKHLMKVILTRPSLSIEDILCHPYFQLVEHLADFEDCMKSWFTREIYEHMEQGREDVFSTAEWTEGLHSEVIRVSKAGENFSGDIFIGLWQAQRDRFYHRNEYPPFIQKEIGVVQCDIFNFWKDNFPAFFLHLFTRIVVYTPPNGTKIYETPPYAGSAIFPASKDFYEVCGQVSIFN